jgi:hypothetical protein
MGIGSWFKKWRKSEDEKKIDRARDEFFDTPQEQRLESQDIQGIQADTQAGMLVRDSRVFEEPGSADAEERLDEEAER